MEQTPADQAALGHLEPVDSDFLAQSGEPMSDTERQDWFKTAADEFREKGATHFRFSTHPEVPNLCLAEAWKTPPANEGEPRWQFQAPEAGRTL